jgi:hypothetical protein
VVVTVGFTVRTLPLVTAPMPLSIDPVPFTNVGVKVAGAPAVIVVGLATKLLIEGAGTTVTVAVAVTNAPAVFVTVKV